MPRLDGTCNPPSPKLRELNGHFVLVPADLEKIERSRSETRVVVLQAGLDDVEERIRQELYR